MENNELFAYFLLTSAIFYGILNDVKMNAKDVIKLRYCESFVRIQLVLTILWPFIVFLRFSKGENLHFGVSAKFSIL